jgi:hypothetical protein
VIESVLVTSLDALPERFRPAATWLAGFCARTPGVVAGYVGGSLVNDRVDAHSDVDANLVTTPETREAVFDALVAGLAEELAVRELWVLPTPTWHGGLQLFGTLDGASVAGGGLVVDVVVDEDKAELLDVDARRHGRPVVLHDPDGRVTVRDGDAAADGALREAALVSARRVADRLPFAAWMVTKAVDRGHWPEAYAYHLRMGVEPLVQLLRTVHCPARWDFGLRYLDDLPDDVAARVEALLPERSRLPAQATACFAWQRALLAELLA